MWITGCDCVYTSEVGGTGWNKKFDGTRYHKKSCYQLQHTTYIYKPPFFSCAFLPLPFSGISSLLLSHLYSSILLSDPFFSFLSFSFFPRASERRVLPIVGVCISSSHLLIFTPSHLHIFSSSHLLIFTSSHLHTFSSSHLLIFTSSHFTAAHLRIFASSHLLIFTSSHLHIFTSSHLHIFTAAHLHIFASSHLLIFTSSHPHIFTSSHPYIFTSSHPHIFTSSPLALLPSPSFLFLF